MESWNGHVKRFLRKLTGNLGQDEETMSGKVAVGVCVVNGQLNGEDTFVTILRVMRAWVRSKAELMA